MLKQKLHPYLVVSYLFFVLSASFGLLYALQLLGIGADLLRPDLVRSLHISLMLYGPVPLVMTLLPFALFDKDGIVDETLWYYLERFLQLWYVFVVFMIFALLAGNTRGLPFYDFPYELNVLLAFAGVFYIVAIFKAIRHYARKPLWVKVSLAAVIISPFALLVLMNPRYGQVEKMLQGPHGDNTLGMSFALLVIYYLAIKLASPRQHFATRWHILWQVPLGAYVLSVLYRSFVGTLSYNAEWFLQYLTLLYLPLLYRWWKDAGLKIREHVALFLSIAAFVFADVEGNILFIPGLRWLFHRNDLVVGHAHIAVAIGLPFLALAIVQPYMQLSNTRTLYLAGMLTMMATVLSISGIEQAGFAPMHTTLWWQLRALFGVLFLVGLLYWPKCVSVFGAKLATLNRYGWYHLAGFLSDGLGGLVLILFGGFVYRLVGAAFHPGYQQIVFGFVAAVGMIHLLALLRPRYAALLAEATVIVRLLTSAGFFALYRAGTLGWIALVISAVDLLYVLVYLLYIRKEQNDEKDSLA